MTSLAVSDDLVDHQAVLVERARALACPVEHAQVTGAEHVVVRVGSQRLAIPAGRAGHVAGPRPITPAPSASGAIVGVAAVLGQVVAVVDVAPLLRVTPAVPLGQRHLVLLDERHESVALLVDGVDRLAVVDSTAARLDQAVGELTSDAGDGLRLLHLDALLEALDPSIARSADPPGGAP